MQEKVNAGQREKDRIFLLHRLFCCVMISKISLRYFFAEAKNKGKTAGTGKEVEKLYKKRIANAVRRNAGKLTAVVTQNIDGLHQAAGSRNVYELHGSIHRNYCMDCGKFYSAEYVKDAEGIPRCECGGMIKPDVVLYEEGLDSATIEGAVRAISNADTLIIGGTSLVVYPAAGFIDYFRGKHLVVINKSETGRAVRAELTIAAPIGEILGRIQVR